MIACIQIRDKEARRLVTEEAKRTREPVAKVATRALIRWYASQSSQQQSPHKQAA
jgi:hypothetical protein